MSDSVAKHTPAAIPMVDLEAEVEALWSELSPAVEAVLRSARFIGGPEVEGFERELAAWLGVPAVVSCNSGTDALLIALQALGVGPGDEVITTPFTFVATGAAILRAGATPVFVDIDESFNFALDQVERAITAQTRAILPVHLFGRPVDMTRVAALAKAHGLLVIEDAAQALSARWRGEQVGTIGDAGCFSFFPSKNLGAYGDGGALVLREPEALARARMLRAHGARRKYHNEILGMNSRLDAIQAAILRVKLPHLAAATAERRAAARRYTQLISAHERLASVSTPPLGDAPDSAWTHSFHQYTIRVPAGRRAGVRELLGQREIASMIYYPKPLPAMPLFGAHELAAWPVTSAAAAEVLSLPIWPGITEAQQRRVVSGLADGLGAR